MFCILNNLLKIVLLILYSVTVVVGECEIRYPNDPLIKPHLSIKIGSRKMPFSNDNDFTTLRSSQEIIASCDIKFEMPNNYKDIRELNLKCYKYNLYINGKKYSSSIILECAALKSSLYELLDPFVWCSSHMASYALARPNGGKMHTYRNFAGICYDTDHMTLSSIYYTMAPKHYSDMSPLALATFELIPKVEINYVKDIFKSKSATYAKYDNEQFRNWITFAKYQYESILQITIKNNEEYKEFSSLLELQWWPNLLLYNWHFYEEALVKHIEKESKAYDILAGISGVVMAPIKDSCETNYTMKNVIDNSNNKIPLYVWNYLNPKLYSKVDAGIVIIGFNSPFNEFYNATDVIFCQDICHTIDWLNNVRSSFRYGIMGVVFCCSVEEVRASKRLSNFPPSMTKSIQETTLSPSFSKTNAITEYIVDNED